MGKYVQWVEHKGVKIVQLNGRGLSEEENFAAQEELKQELLRVRTSPPVLVDLSNTTMTQKTSAKSKELAAATKEAGLPDGPTAIVGLTGIQKAVAQLFSRGSHFFNNVDEAREWLAREQGKRRQ